MHYAQLSTKLRQSLLWMMFVLSSTPAWAAATVAADDSSASRSESSVAQRNETHGSHVITIKANPFERFMVFARAGQSQPRVRIANGQFDELGIAEIEIPVSDDYLDRRPGTQIIVVTESVRTGITLLLSSCERGERAAVVESAATPPAPGYCPQPPGWVCFKVGVWCLCHKLGLPTGNSALKHYL